MNDALRTKFNLMLTAAVAFARPLTSTTPKTKSTDSSQHSVERQPYRLIAGASAEAIAAAD